MGGAPAFPRQGRLSAIQQLAVAGGLANRITALVALEPGQRDAGESRGRFGCGNLGRQHRVQPMGARTNPASGLCTSSVRASLASAALSTAALTNFSALAGEVKSRRSPCAFSSAFDRTPISRLAQATAAARLPVGSDTRLRLSPRTAAATTDADPQGFRVLAAGWASRS